ncbi:septum formation protein Maf [Candidatus Peribacteria bacterium RIFOXYC1_FULL_58_8]|nr:MAG: septum formation protein Maf [Candidatus Peribacteria bacterium RIFOXYB1_FULL_57_12]OGJ80191.1 MAG: septum formation protein Maf [Candidatus Peribacteria bacterium RIFOXYC1_FULL_58_8]
MSFRYHVSVQHKLVLASASPQRRQLLEGLGVPFEVYVTGVEDESDVTHRDPVERAQFFAHLKAERAHSVHPHAWIIGCDTLVMASDGTLLEKPRSADEARSMIRLQSGKISLVHSGLCVLDPKGEAQEGMSTSSVTFKRLSPQEVDWWISTKLWEGRSGSFQIDGLGQMMIERIEGDWSSVVGLPVFLLGELLKKAGWDLGIGD